MITEDDRKTLLTKALRHAVRVCHSKRLSFKAPAYNMACDEISISLEAAIERVEAGEPMAATATVQNEPETEPAARLACDNRRCNWTGDDGTVLKAADPFNEGCELMACPKCLTQTIRTCCDEPGCFEQDTCGTPTPNGYRRTCGRHCP